MNSKSIIESIALFLLILMAGAFCSIIVVKNNNEWWGWISHLIVAVSGFIVIRKLDEKK